MENNYYSSGIFYDWGWEFIFDWILSLPYFSILKMAHTCKYMYTLCHQAAKRKEYIVKENAKQDILEELVMSGYLKKIEELGVKYPIALGGDFVLSKITSLKFNSNYIDLYIGNPPPYHETNLHQFIWALFKLNVKDSEFKLLKQNCKFGQTTFHIALKTRSLHTKALCIHLVRGDNIAKYIESKFDLTTSMIWFDLREIYTTRFWQQFHGLGYVNNDYFIDDTGKRIIRWSQHSKFRIIDDCDFNWDVYNYDPYEHHDDDSLDMCDYSDEGFPNYYDSDS